MKRIILTIEGIIFTAVCIISFAFICEDPTIPFSRENVSKIEITNGSSGRMTVTTQKNVIGSLYDSVDSASLKKTAQDKYLGWTYSITMHSGSDTYTVTLVSDKVWIVNGTRYAVHTKPGTSAVSLIKQTERSAK